MEAVRKWGLFLVMIVLALAFVGHTLQALLTAHEPGLQRTWDLTRLGLQALLVWLAGGGAAELIRRRLGPARGAPEAGS